jgi:hypothetical protein
MIYFSTEFEKWKKAYDGQGPEAEKLLEMEVWPKVDSDKV